MPSLRQLALRVAERVARTVSENELFEKPGERPLQSPLSSKDHAQAPANSDHQAQAPANSEHQSLAPANSEHQSLAPAEDAAPAGVETLNSVGLEQRLATGRLIVNHWATWCDGCIEELPELLRLQAGCPGDVRMVGVGWELFTGGTIEEAEARVAETAAAHGLSHPTLIVSDPPADFFAFFGIESEQIPQTWLMKDGKVIERIHGLLDQDAVTRLLGILEQG